LQERLNTGPQVRPKVLWPDLFQEVVVVPTNRATTVNESGEGISDSFVCKDNKNVRDLKLGFQLLLGWLFRTEFRQIPGNSGESQIGTPANMDFALVIPGASAKYSVFFTGCTQLYQRYLRKSPTAYIYEESFRTSET
jgi:hypothetical protein